MSTKAPSTKAALPTKTAPEAALFAEAAKTQISSILLSLLPHLPQRTEAAITSTSIALPH